MKISISIVLTASFAFLNAWGEGIEVPKSSEPVAAKAPCGLSGKIKERISNCSTKKALVSRDRQSKGHWSLVTRTNKGFEVWRDDTSGDLWSDWLSPVAPFYSKDDYAFPFFLDSEIPGACSSSNELLELGIDEVWTLPSYTDFKRAESHGSLKSLPHFLLKWEPSMGDDRYCIWSGVPYASSTPTEPGRKEIFYRYAACSGNRAKTWENAGGFNQGNGVRCIARLNGKPASDSLTPTQARVDAQDQIFKAGLVETVKKYAETVSNCSDAKPLGHSCRMSFENAVKFCRDNGMHLPTAKEFAQFSQALGATGITTIRLAGSEHIVSKNQDGSIDKFYFGDNGYNRPNGDLGEDWFWTSSTDGLGNKYFFNGYFGHIGILYQLNNLAVRCATGQRAR